MLAFTFLPPIVVMGAAYAFWKGFKTLTILQEIALLCFAWSIFMELYFYFFPPGFIDYRIIQLSYELRALIPLGLVLFTILVFWKRFRGLTGFQKWSLLLLELVSLKFLLFGLFFFLALSIALA